MKIQRFILLLTITCLSAFASDFQVTTETFTTLDREIAGLMDSWVLIREEQIAPTSGLFNTGTAILRAEIAYQAALQCGTGNLPDTVEYSWNQYLKSSADCISQMKKAVSSSNVLISEDILLSSFIRWETIGERFLGSIQSTR